MFFQQKKPATNSRKKIIIMLLILLPANNLVIDQFRAYQKINSILWKYINKNLANGLIFQFKYPFGALIFFIPKPNGGLQLCVNYWSLKILLSRIVTLFFQLASFQTGLAMLSNLQKQTLLIYIIRYVSKKAINKKPLFKLGIATINTLLYHLVLLIYLLFFNHISTNIQLESWTFLHYVFR